MQKFCTSCLLPHELTSFNKDKSKRDGLSSWCKDCKRKNRQAYEDAHRLDRSNRSRSWYIKNASYVKEKSAKWKAANKDKVALYRASSYKDRVLSGKKKLEADKWVEEMQPSYIRNLMGKGMSVSGCCIPDELVEAKRLHLCIVRFLRKESE